jgi:hypothetical protein
LHGAFDNAVVIFDSDFKATTDVINNINQSLTILSDIGDFNTVQYNIIGNERYSYIQTNKSVNERAWIVDQSGYAAIGPISINGANSFIIKNVTGTLLYSFGTATTGTGIQRLSLTGEEAEITVPNGYTIFAVSISGLTGFDNALIYRDTDKSDICKEIKKIELDTKKTITVDKNGNGDYTTLIDAIKDAEKQYGSVVYVNSGIYDLVSELGSTYVEWASESQRGIYLKNGIVKDRTMHIKVLEDVKSVIESYGMGIEKMIASPILGGSGNKEFLIYVKRSVKSKVNIIEVCK